MQIKDNALAGHFGTTAFSQTVGNGAFYALMASNTTTSYVVDDSVFATKAYVDSGVAGVDLSGYTTTADLTSNDLDLNGNKVLFGNVYSTLADLPSATTYHGMFAHVHATGKGYFAHAGNWVELANSSDLVTQSDIDTAVNTAVANIVDTAPDSLNTLNELAAALGDDANFASTMTTSLASKADSTALDAAVADIATNTTALATKATSAQGALADTAVQPSDLGQLASFSASTGLSAVTNTVTAWPTDGIVFDSAPITHTFNEQVGPSTNMVANSTYVVVQPGGASADLYIFDRSTGSLTATIDMASYSSNGGYATSGALQVDENNVYVSSVLGGATRTWAFRLSDQTLLWDLAPSGKELRMAGMSEDGSELIMVASVDGDANAFRTKEASCISVYDGSTTVSTFDIPATTYHPTRDYFVTSAVKTDSLIIIGAATASLYRDDYSEGIVFVFDSNGTHLQTIGTPNFSNPGSDPALPSSNSDADGFGKQIGVWNNKIVILSRSDRTYDSERGGFTIGDDAVLSIWTQSASGITLESHIGLNSGTTSEGGIDPNGTMNIVGDLAYINGHQAFSGTAHWRGGVYIVNLSSGSLVSKLQGPDQSYDNNESRDPDGANAYFGIQTASQNGVQDWWYRFEFAVQAVACLLYTSPSPRDRG